jgi:hypothetical protein
MNNDWKPFGINEGQGSNTVSSYSTWDYMRIEQPKRICRCDLFGQGQMVISFYDAQSSLFPIVGLDFGHEYSSIVNGTLKMNRKLWDIIRDDLGYSIDCTDEIVDAVEKWLPKPQSAAGSQMFM